MCYVLSYTASGGIIQKTGARKMRETNDGVKITLIVMFLVIVVVAFIGSVRALARFFQY
jgi:hypothetical protein